MLLISHIVIALTSVLVSTFLYFSPSKAKLYATYGLIGATLSTGTYLILSTRSHMLQSCLMGLVYSTFSIIIAVAARNRLAGIKVRNNE